MIVDAIIQGARKFFLDLLIFFVSNIRKTNWINLQKKFPK